MSDRDANAFLIRLVTDAISLLLCRMQHAFPGTYLLPKRYCDRGMSVR